MKIQQGALLGDCSPLTADISLASFFGTCFLAVSWATQAFADLLCCTCAHINCTCRSVQTAFSLAESIGYSTDFVLGSAEEEQPVEALPESEGVTMATLLCWTTVVVLVVAGSCWVVRSIVA